MPPSYNTCIPFKGVLQVISLLRPVWTFIKVKVKVSSYRSQYPILGSAQDTLYLLPGKHHLDISGSIQPFRNNATTARRLPVNKYPPLYIALYSFTWWTGSMSSEWPCPN